MITLHGKYKNGNIIINEKKLPKLEADVNIQIIEPNDIKKQKRKKMLGKYKLHGIFDNKNIRDLAYDWKYCIRYQYFNI